MSAVNPHLAVGGSTVAILLGIVALLWAIMRAADSRERRQMERDRERMRRVVDELARKEAR